MRELDLFELESRVSEFATEIEYVDFQHLQIKLNQFVDYLISQPISNRILQRIEEDFKEVVVIPTLKGIQDWQRQKRLFIESINSPEKQGAFGYLAIINLYHSEERLQKNGYIDIANYWYGGGSQYSEWQTLFNTMFFKPFIRLFDWYISDSQSNNQDDYFSKDEISEFEDKLDELLSKVSTLENKYDIFYNEIQDLKESLKKQSKKHWTEMLKGKLIDFAYGKVLSIDGINIAYKLITGDSSNILNP